MESCTQVLLSSYVISVKAIIKSTASDSDWDCYLQTFLLFLSAREKTAVGNTESSYIPAYVGKGTKLRRQITERVGESWYQ